MSDAPVLVLSEMDKEVRLQLQDEHTKRALLQTTFKGLNEDLMRQAILEGMMRGYSFKSFLIKDVYAIPFSGGYSLITSIDNARKIGARSGIVGVYAPIFEERADDTGVLSVISCTMTVKKMFANGHIGDFTAKVEFQEYYKPGFYNKSNEYVPSMWDKKPKTMIGKVAEMHALRKACPDELSGQYMEEEFAKDIKSSPEEIVAKVEQGMNEIKPIPDEITDEIVAKVEADKPE